MSHSDQDPTLAAVRAGEERAEREYLLEHGQPVPEHLKPDQCRRGIHIVAYDRADCLLCGEVI